jgi:CRISPR/Cas system-associated endonuclease Cas1
MEPLRPIVDRAILGIVQTHTFTPGDFTLLDSGVCRVNPQMAAAVVERITYSAEVDRLAKHVENVLVG